MSLPVIERSSPEVIYSVNHRENEESTSATDAFHWLNEHENAMDTFDKTHGRGIRCKGCQYMPLTKQILKRFFGKKELHIKKRIYIKTKYNINMLSNFKMHIKNMQQIINHFIETFNRIQVFYTYKNDCIV